MRWYELAQNPEEITRLYNNVPPLLDVELSEVKLIRIEAKMSMWISLSRYVDRPSIQWTKSRYNTTLVQLDFMDLQHIQISRWSTSQRISIEIGPREDGKVSISIVTANFDIRAEANSFRIGNIRAYQQRP